MTRMLHDLGWRYLSDRRRDLRLTLLYKVVSHWTYVAVGHDQIGLVAADNRTRENHRFKFRAIGASSSGLRSSFAARTVGDWNQLPAVVVEQEIPAAFKNQLGRLAPVACRNAPLSRSAYSERSAARYLYGMQLPNQFRTYTNLLATIGYNGY